MTDDEIKVGDPVLVFLPYPNTSWHRAQYLGSHGDAGFVVIKTFNGCEHTVHRSLVQTDRGDVLPDDVKAEMAQISRVPSFWVIDYDVSDVPTHWITSDQAFIAPYIANLCRSVKISNVRITALYRSKISKPYPMPRPRDGKE